MRLGLIRKFGFVLLAAALALSGCKGSDTDLQAKGGADAKGNPSDKGGGRGGRGGRGAPGGPSGITVRTIGVERMSFQREVELSGTLLSQDTVRVSAEASGMVKDVLVELGQEVKAGQVIVQIEPRELQLALDRAESALRQTEAQLGIDPSRAGQVPADDQVASVRTAMANRDDARAQLGRSQELQSKGLAPKADLDTVQTRVKVTEAQYQQAIENVHALKASLQDRRASYELAKKKLEDAQVRAPVSGAISDRPVQRGEFMRENTVVATIVQLSPLKLKSAVQEKYANLIRPNLTVKFAVEPYPTESFNGSIRYISPAIDQLTRTFTVEVMVDNASRKLKPGFFAKGQILTKKDDNVMAVPDEAVVMLAGVASVYVVDEKGEVRQRNIQIGETEGKFHEVVSGLDGTEKLAASNVNLLVSGMIVSTGGGRGNRGSGEEVGPAEGAAPNAIAPGGENGGQRRGGRGGRRGQGTEQRGGGNQ
jgi:RND family efflux transporter MFP subunit